MLDGEAFGAEVVDLVKGYVERTVAPLLSRIDEIERRSPVLADGQLEKIVERVTAAVPKPENGKDANPTLIQQMVENAVSALPTPKDGEPGRDADPNEVSQMVAAAVAALPPAKDGESVDTETVRGMIVEAVAREMALLPPPKDGENASVEDIRPVIRQEVEREIAGIPLPKDGVGLAGALIDRTGALIITLSDGSTRELGPVVGQDADMAALQRLIVESVERIPAPKNGQDGFGFDDLSVEPLGERGFVLKFVQGERTKEFSFDFPVVLDRGVFKADGTYERGDAVTWGGSLWIAQRSTSSKPGDGDDWRLAVKRGRDGKPAS